ncbi:aminoglycoside phosphotransferase family protein [Lentzea flaviverrucosa]|uniref:Streptomycin 6-kinase n=1 Tax=Lentzea flaviverrucosa TaxID=200379 RepID=A0A1H9WUB3_9PSEU|nr:aminoglycoside phosphotransferase family protein [Lentzea flaviverrucosa]RDI23102.1 streptomycin 6-kinase [Lentzea flaviverrucosa]SES37381.1 streptomycin 6-kinase [Lentzea flaviverrucosa]
MIEVPAKFVQATAHREGEPGLRWIESLPVVVGELLDRWSCHVTGPATHGFVAVIVPVRRADGSDAVIKVSWPHPGNVAEPFALAAWAGRGAVRLLERDDERFAMLLERLAPESLGSVDDVIRGVAVAGELARQLAVPAPPSVPALAEVTAHWEENLEAESELLGHPHPHRVLDAALATARELGRDQPRTLVHGDLHFGNILRGDRSPWLTIDPKGWAGDLSYDVLTLLRARWADAVAEPDLRRALLRRVEVFADAAGVDSQRVRRWAQARAVAEAQVSRRYREPAEITAVCDEIATLLAD